MNRLCDRCKKSGRVWCPHNAALEIRARLAPSLKQEMFGPTPPGMFVGHSFYPNVYWGPMVSAEHVEDDPSNMYGMALEKIIESRASMVRGMRRGSVKAATGRMLEASQEAVMSIKPVDVEARFAKTPEFRLELDDVAHPVGASAPIERFFIADNPAIPKRVDELYNESAPAQDALRELLVSGFDVHYLSKLLMAGILGRRGGRKLVPTKWAITATDDMAAKRFMESVRDCRELEEVRVYSNEYLDNRFFVLLLPGGWEYEQFEALLTPELEERKRKRAGADGIKFAHASWADWKCDGRVNMSEEHEPFFGRSGYAERQGGGYYAARFSVCEALYKIRRQARAIVFREIGANYSVPVGVWEVRENVRHAFLNGPARFSGKEDALGYLSEKLSIPLKEYVARSKILLQRRLTEF